VNYGWDSLIYDPNELIDLDIAKERLNLHYSLRINYTSYDMRRQQDCIRPFLRITPTSVKRNSDRCFVVLAAEEVMTTFHVLARLRSDPGADYKRLDVVWLRWLGDEPGYKSGFQAERLERVGFVPDDGRMGPFGFVDPNGIIRGASLQPVFELGRRFDLLERSFCQDTDGDWGFFDVIRLSEFTFSQREDKNLTIALHRFVDCDMAMRYRGGGVGHIDLKQVVNEDNAYETEPDGDSTMEKDAIVGEEWNEEEREASGSEEDGGDSGADGSDSEEDESDSEDVDEGGEDSDASHPDADTD